MAELMEMLYDGRTCLGPRNNVLDGSQDRTNPFTSAMGDKSAMQPFAKLLWTLVITVNCFGYRPRRASTKGV